MTFCPSCRAAAGAECGTPASRALRALVLGSAAAILSAATWYAVIVWTGRELGLLAVGVGLLVGAAVRRGSFRRGGWRYQALAMALTYLAIVTAYVPILFRAALDASHAAAEAPLAVDPMFAAGGEAALAAALLSTEREPDSARQSAPIADAASDIEVPLDPGDVLLALAAFAGLVVAAPFLAGFENLLGWVLLAIALYEAWKLNRREELVFEGPLHPSGHGPVREPEVPPAPISP